LCDARKRFSAILREIESDPGTGYRIPVRKRVIAELRSPALCNVKAGYGNGETVFACWTVSGRGDGGQLKSTCMETSPWPVLERAGSRAFADTSYSLAHAPVWEVTDEDRQQIIAVNIPASSTAAAPCCRTCARAATGASSELECPFRLLRQIEAALVRIREPGSWLLTRTAG